MEKDIRVAGDQDTSGVTQLSQGQSCPPSRQDTLPLNEFQCEIVQEAMEKDIRVAGDQDTSSVTQLSQGQSCPPSRQATLPQSSLEKGAFETWLERELEIANQNQEKKLSVDLEREAPKEKQLNKKKRRKRRKKGLTEQGNALGMSEETEGQKEIQNRRELIKGNGMKRGEVVEGMSETSSESDTSTERDIDPANLTINSEQGAGQVWLQGELERALERQKIENNRIQIQKIQTCMSFHRQNGKNKEEMEKMKEELAERMLADAWQGDCEMEEGLAQEQDTIAGTSRMCSQKDDTTKQETPEVEVETNPFKSIGAEVETNPFKSLGAGAEQDSQNRESKAEEEYSIPAKRREETLRELTLAQSTIEDQQRRIDDLERVHGALAAWFERELAIANQSQEKKLSVDLEREAPKEKQPNKKKQRKRRKKRLIEQGNVFATSEETERQKEIQNSAEPNYQRVELIKEENGMERGEVVEGTAMEAVRQANEQERMSETDGESDTSSERDSDPANLTVNLEQGAGQAWLRGELEKALQRQKIESSKIHIRKIMDQEREGTSDETERQKEIKTRKEPNELKVELIKEENGMEWGEVVEGTAMEAVRQANEQERMNETSSESDTSNEGDSDPANLTVNSEQGAGQAWLRGELERALERQNIENNRVHIQKIKTCMSFHRLNGENKEEMEKRKEELAERMLADAWQRDGTWKMGEGLKQEQDTIAGTSRMCSQKDDTTKQETPEAEMETSELKILRAGTEQENQDHESKAEEEYSIPAERREETLRELTLAQSTIEDQQRRIDDLERVHGALAAWFEREPEIANQSQEKKLSVDLEREAPKEKQPNKKKQRKKGLTEQGNVLGTSEETERQKEIQNKTEPNYHRVELIKEKNGMELGEVVEGTAMEAVRQENEQARMSETSSESDTSSERDSDPANLTVNSEQGAGQAWLRGELENALQRQKIHIRKIMDQEREGTSDETERQKEIKTRKEPNELKVELIKEENGMGHGEIVEGTAMETVRQEHEQESDTYIERDNVNLSVHSEQEAGQVRLQGELERVHRLHGENNRIQIQKIQTCMTSHTLNGENKEEMEKMKEELAERMLADAWQRDGTWEMDEGLTQEQDTIAGTSRMCSQKDDTTKQETPEVEVETSELKILGAGTEQENQDHESKAEEEYSIPAERREETLRELTLAQSTIEDQQRRIDDLERMYMEMQQEKVEAQRVSDRHSEEQERRIGQLEKLTEIMMNEKVEAQRVSERHSEEQERRIGQLEKLTENMMMKIIEMERQLDETAAHRKVEQDRTTIEEMERTAGDTPTGGQPAGVNSEHLEIICVREEEKRHGQEIMVSGSRTENCGPENDIEMDAKREGHKSTGNSRQAEDHTCPSNDMEQRGQSAVGSLENVKPKDMEMDTQRGGCSAAGIAVPTENGIDQDPGGQSDASDGPSEQLPGGLEGEQKKKKKKKSVLRWMRKRLRIGQN
ncbi:trichohyalin-like [Engraulis encrasicolus]|uniref:trichohyalin-like n=1 Tax=Engraulis encrasicolus TaxID=184585 RepID=UPI002FD36E05